MDHNMILDSIMGAVFKTLERFSVNSHSLPPELPPCRLGFGFRSEMCDDWHFRGASKTISLEGYMFSVHHVDFEYAQTFPRSFRKVTEHTYLRETFRCA